MTSGAVLLQNPFDKNKYYLESKAMEKISQDKFLHFSTLCQYLGAREVKIEKIFLKKDGNEKSLEIRGGVPAMGDGILDTQRKELRSFANHISLIHEFDGSEPDIPGATKYLKNFGLSNETIMQDMLNKAQIQNRPRNLKINLILTTEVHQNFTFLASLNLSAIQPPISFEGNYDRNEFKQTEYRLTIEVKF